MASLLDQIDPLATRVSLLDRLSQGEQVTQQERDALDQASSNSMGELEKGLRRSGYNLTASTEAFVGQMAEPFAPEFARRRFAGANETLRSMPTSLTPAVSSFAEAQRTGDYLPYAAGALGEGLGSAIPTVIAGLLTRGATLRAAPAVQNAASFVAGAGTMLPQEGGETALQLQNSPQALANTTPAERAALTLGRGTVGAVAETLVPEMLLTRPLAGAARAIEPGLRSAAGNFGRKAVAGGLGEAGTEAAQELVGQYAQNLAVPGTGYDLERVKEAAIAGALPGTVIGGTGAMVQAARSNLGAGIQKSTEASNKLLNTAVEQLDSALRNPEEFGYTAGNATLGALAEVSARAREVGDAAGPAAASAMDTIAAMRGGFDRAVVGRLTPENRRKYVDLTQNFRLLQPTEYERLRDALALGDADGINEAVGDVAFQLRERVPRETLDGLKNITDWGKRFGQGVTTAAREGRKAAQGYTRDDIVRFRAFLNEAHPDVLRTMDSTDASDQLSRLLMTYRDNAQLLNTSLRPKDQQAVEYFEKVTGKPLADVLVDARNYANENVRRRDVEQMFEDSTGDSQISRVTSDMERLLTDDLREEYEASGIEIGPGATNVRDADGNLMDVEEPSNTPFSALQLVRQATAATNFKPNPAYSIPAHLTSEDLTPEQIGMLVGNKTSRKVDGKWIPEFGELTDEQIAARVSDKGFEAPFNTVDIAAQAGTPRERGGHKENFEPFVPQFEGNDRDLGIQGYRLMSAIAALDTHGIEIPRSDIPEATLQRMGLDPEGDPIRIKVNMPVDAIGNDTVVQRKDQRTITLGDLTGANRAARALPRQLELLELLGDNPNGKLQALKQSPGREGKTASALSSGLYNFAVAQEAAAGSDLTRLKAVEKRDVINNHASAYAAQLRERIDNAEQKARDKRNTDRLKNALRDGLFEPETVNNHINELDDAALAWADALELEYTSTDDLMDTLAEFRDNDMQQYELQQAVFEEEPATQEPTADDEYEARRKSPEGVETTLRQRGIDKQADPQALPARTAPKALNAVQRGVIIKAITRLKTVPELDELQAGLPALAKSDAAFVNGLIDRQRAALAEAPTEKLTKAQVAIREQKAKIAAQRAAAERPAPQTPFAKRVTIVHSGGAAGADLLWQRMAEEAGVPVQAHSFAGHAKDNAARVEHSREELLQADDALRQANKTLNRRYPPGSAFVRHLLQRSYFQVKDADMVLAVSRIDNNGQVEGGTAWATQMGADMGKSVYVFDQYTRRWHKWDTTAGEYVLSEAPVAQGAIAGIGTRELVASGAQAIRDIVGGKATEALRVLEGRREGESNVDYVRRMKLQQTQPPKRSTHIEPQKPAPKKQALVQKPANERNSPPAPPGETKPLSAYERRLVSGAEFSKKTLPAQIVNNWAKKYLGGADVRVVEYDPRDPEVQEYFGGADKMPRGRAINANYFAPNTPAMILIQRSTSKQAGTRYGRMHVLAHEFGHIIDYIALRNAPEEVKALIDQAYKRIVTDAVADGRTDEAMFNAGTVLRFIHDADKNSVLTGDDPVIQNHQRLAEGMVARKERGDQDYIFRKEEFFAEQFAKYAMNDPNIFAGESKTVRAYLDKVLAQVKKFYREVILQLDKTAPEFDAFMKWLGTPTAERPAFPDYDPTAWDERNPPPIDGTQETAPPAQDPPQGPPQGPPAGGQPPPTLPPDDAAREQFRATVKRLLGNRVAVEFDQSLGEGVAGEYVSRFGKDLEDTGKALGVVRENRRGELRALKARRTATDEDIADGKADPRTPEQIEESIRSLEAQEQAYLNDLAVRGTIRVASGMEAQAGVAEHESLHAAFEIFFGDNNASDRKAITTAFTQGVLARRLQNYFRDNPDVLAVIDPTSTDFRAEEAAAYGFQVFLHDPGALQMGQKVEGIFNRLLQFLQGLVGYKTYEERARTIFNDLNSGKRAERGTSVLRDRVGMEQSMLSRSQDFVRGVGTGFMHMYDTVLSSTYSRMANSGNAAMAQIARLGYNATGETGQGMIQLQRQQTMQWSNRLKEALHALSVEELGQLNQAMLLNEELSGKLGQAQQRLRTVLTDVHRYQQEAGVDLGYIEDYYPMIWSPEKVSADYQGFIDMLQQYPEQLAEMNATADEVFERIASYEERGHEFQGIFGKDGEPVADSSRRRSLAFISPEDRLKYMEDDLMVTMAHYLNQSVRHAEYVRAYGQNGARMRELLGEIRGVYGGSQDDVDLAKDYIDGLMGNKEIGMSRELKDLYGAATVYQNVRLLPLSVFSSLVDPLGVAIRTDSAGAAFDTFTYSLRNLFTDFRKDWTPDMWEKYAADMGTIDMSGTVKSIDKIYTGVTLRGKTREINDGFFKWNLLNGWVKNNHIMATKAAQAYLRRSAEGMFGEERSAENLREAGVQPGDIVFDETLGRIRSTAPEILGYGNADEMEQRATEEEIAGARAQADRIQQAVHKIVRQSLIQPSSAELPGWLSNPYLAPIAHLKTFVFGFNATILNRLVYEAKRGNYNPIYYAAAYVPGMIAADFLKGLAGNGGEEPEWQKNWTAADYLAYGVNRSGLTGTGQFFVDMNNDVTRGGGGWESLAGPTIEQAKELMAAMNAKTSNPTETWMRNALPAHALYDQWLK